MSDLYQNEPAARFGGGQTFPQGQPPPARERGDRELRRSVRALRQVFVTDRALSTTRGFAGLRLTASGLPSVGTLGPLTARTADTTYPGTLDVSQTMLDEAHTAVRLLIDAMIDSGLLS